MSLDIDPIDLLRRVYRPADATAHTTAALHHSNDYFDFFHAGQFYPRDRAIPDNGPLPRNIGRPRPDPALDARQPRRRRRRQRPFWQDQRRDDGADRTVRGGVRAFLEAQGVVIERVLGAGSQGLAVLVRYRGRRRVVKYSIEIEALVIEMWTMNQMAGAKHIVQRHYVDPFVDDSVYALINDEFMNIILDGRYNLDGLIKLVLGMDPEGEPMSLMYMMEYMKHGSLNRLLHRISIEQRAAWLKSSELWRVFYCLFRSVVALAYPGHFNPPNFDPSQPMPPTPAQQELIPRAFAQGPPAATNQSIIDFDMNDRNVMLGGYDTGDTGDPATLPHAHDQVPVVKVGDFGHVRAFRGAEQQQSMHCFVAGRVCGNIWCNTPEQFARAWDDYGPDDVDTLQRGADTAGQYDWWTNLWMAAQLMNILITQLQPPLPPDCVCAALAVPTVPPRVEDVFTYGSHLVLDKRYRSLDTDLRATVAWCMAHRPRDRPDMDELEGIFQRAMGMAFAGDNDPRRDTIGDLLDSPPPPPPAVPRDWTAPAQNVANLVQQWDNAGT